MERERERERRDAGDGEVVSAEAEGPLPGPGSQHCRCCNRGAPAGAMTRQRGVCAPGTRIWWDRVTVSGESRSAGFPTSRSQPPPGSRLVSWIPF